MSPEGKRILILGAGFGGLTAANLLQKNLSSSSAPAEHPISITDQKDYFMMGLVNFLNGEVTAIDTVSKSVTIRGSSTLRLEYDYLVIALGAEFALEQV